MNPDKLSHQKRYVYLIMAMVFVFSVLYMTLGIEFILYLLQFLITVVIAYYVSILVHELGHLVLGLLTGFRFVSFRLSKWLLKRNDEGVLKIYRYNLKGTAGQCLMAPNPHEYPDLFWYNFGGVLFNGITALLSFTLFMVTEQTVIKQITLTFVLINVMFVILNWILKNVPSSDGNNYRAIKNNESSRIAFLELLQLNAALNQGARLSEYDLSSLKNLNLRGSDSIQKNAMQYSYSKAFFNRDFESMSAQLDSLYRISDGAIGLVDSLIRTDYYFLKLLENDPDAKAFKTNDVVKILDSMRYVESIYIIILVEDFRENNRWSESMQEEFTNLCQTSISSGNGKDCLEILEYLKETL